MLSDPMPDLKCCSALSLSVVALPYLAARHPPSRSLAPLLKGKSGENAMKQLGG